MKEHRAGNASQCPRHRGFMQTLGLEGGAGFLAGNLYTPKAARGACEAAGLPTYPTNVFLDGLCQDMGDLADLFDKTSLAERPPDAEQQSVGDAVVGDR